MKSVLAGELVILTLLLFVVLTLQCKKPLSEKDQQQATATTPASTGSQDGVEMVTVPEGEFFMGCNEKVDTECDKNEKPGRTVAVKAFQIDKTEVTVAQYGKCVDAGVCNSEGLTMPYWETGTEPYKEHPEWAWACNWGKAGREQHPINCVTWQQAHAYCEWAAKRLPTEAEWEKAARGADGRKYPWGNQGYDAARLVANIRDETYKSNRPEDQVVEGYNDNYYGTAPVGSFPAGASPYGALDMIGNVMEWTADWYDAQHKFWILRGGSWTNRSRYARVSFRYRGDAPKRSEMVGFRCAR